VTTSERLHDLPVASADAPAETTGRSFAAYLSRLSAGSLIPGAGLILAGRRRSGLVVLGTLGTVLVVLLLIALQRPREDLLGLALDPDALLALAVVLVGAAVGMVLNGAVSYRRLAEGDRPRWQRVTSATAALALVAVTAIPLAIGSYYAVLQRDVVESVFGTDIPVALGNSRPDTPVVAAADQDPWADTPRLNVLLLGSDSGAGRVGARTDTVVVASIDTETGRTTLFSLPRNLQQVPFPADEPIADAYPWGFYGDGSIGSDLLNAVYDTVPAYHPELFEGVEDPGAEAVKLAAEGILGIPVDYYVMVNMEGFQRLVDALGGIEVNVRTTIPMENKVLAAGVCSEPTGYIYPGRQVLDGWQTMWYARARCGGEGVSDDYDRMRRQRCVIGAMIDRSDPLNILRQFEQLASATKEMVSSDIPQSKLSSFVALALRVKDGEVASLPFTNQVINPAYPDYAGIQLLVQDALEPPKPKAKGGADQPSADGATQDTPADSTGDVTSPSTPDEGSGAITLDDVC
jgi:LCP family protein required for cell wall assembly